MKLLPILMFLFLSSVAISAEGSPAEMPEFQGIERWLNTDKPITKESLKGKVVLVAFWTQACGNCIHTLPHVNQWYKKYRGKGFEIIGVHTPEFDFERKQSNVQKAIKKFGIEYPVAMDNDYKTWNVYSNRYWPAHYFVDRKGRIRHQHFGEGQYESSEKYIRQLLAEP